MIPAGALNRIRSANIHHYNHHIQGFSFFDKDGARLYRIGNIDRDFSSETVEIAENEVIIGVVAKLWPGW